MRYRLKGATDEETAQVMQVAKETLANVTANEISRMWPEVLAGILPRVYPEMLAEVYRHQDAGRKTYIVSAAGADGFSLATVLGMDGGIGTRYVVNEDGVYTGELEARSSTGPARSRRWKRSRSRTGSTSPSPGPTPIRRPTCRCSGPSERRRSQPGCSPARRRKGRRVAGDAFPTLGRNIAVAGTVGAAVLLGGLGSWHSKRR